MKVIYLAGYYKMMYATDTILDKPLVIISTIGAATQPSEDLKNIITADMKQRGYNAADYYLYYTDPALSQFNTVKPEDVPLD